MQEPFVPLGLVLPSRPLEGAGRKRVLVRPCSGFAPSKKASRDPVVGRLSIGRTLAPDVPIGLGVVTRLARFLEPGCEWRGERKSVTS